MEIVDAQVHIPRLVVEGDGRRRTTPADVPPPKALGIALVDPVAPETVLAATLTAMDAAGIDAVVVDEWLGQDETGHAQPGVRVGDGATRWDFGFSTYAAERFPERFSFLARVHPRDPELDRVVDTLAATPGMRSLRVDPAPWLPDIDLFAEGGYAPVFAAARRLGLPVMVWCSGPYLAHLPQYLKDFPDVRIVLDHMGVSQLADFATVFDLARSFDNLALKWSKGETRSREPYPFPDVARHLGEAVEAFGAPRIMWASDWSEHQVQLSWAESHRWLRDSGQLSADEARWVLGRTARTLLGWPAVGDDPKGSGYYLDCSTTHGMIRVAAPTLDGFVLAMGEHMAAWHPHHRMTPGQIAARARHWSTV